MLLTLFSFPFDDIGNSKRLAFASMPPFRLLAGTVLTEEELRRKYHSIHGGKSRGLREWCRGFGHAIMGLEPEEYQEVRVRL